jgi:quercetin dioxygenase-like cupin family protein
LILRLTDHRDGVETGPGDHVVYDVDRDTAYVGAGRVAGRALVWELTERPSPGEWLLRCDRVDFPPGGEAFLHTHQGPGIRVLLFGSIRIETQGATHSYGPGEPWFETGPDPVHAWTHGTEPTAFVRCMVLPRALQGSPSIRYVRDEDRERPKSQSYTVFLDEPVVL